jgi:hypothetical protein
MTRADAGLRQTDQGGRLAGLLALIAIVAVPVALTIGRRWPRRDQGGGSDRRAAHHGATR